MPLGTHGRRTPIAYALGGGSADPEKNVALFNVVKKARADGVPKANIESALQKVRAYVVSCRLDGGPRVIVAVLNHTTSFFSPGR
jgi:hypothetical protein